ncbi:MAG: response regulator [Myxococcales bacterium]|nr:response regulator [Myxococcales bacterium]
MARVLVVEDSEVTRAYVRGALSSVDVGSAPLEVVEAESGFAALRLLPRGSWDLVITDVNMPDINGLELLSFIRQSERHRATPVLLMSTQTSSRDRERGLALGAVGYLSKPFTPEQLRDAALRHLGPTLDERGHG